MPIFNPDVETMERKNLQELQIERLQIVVNQAYANVDFYRRKFEGRVEPGRREEPGRSR